MSLVCMWLEQGRKGRGKERGRVGISTTMKKQENFPRARGNNANTFCSKHAQIFSIRAQSVFNFMQSYCLTSSTVAAQILKQSLFNLMHSLSFMLRKFLQDLRPGGIFKKFTCNFYSFFMRMYNTY